MLIQPVTFQSTPIVHAHPLLQPLILLQPAVHQIPDRSLLAADEAEKADRFVKDDDRSAFILRRSTLRRLLSGWLNVSPQEITYLHETHGKPVLKASPLHFNISKTTGLNIYYFGPQEAGIDVELIDPNRRFSEIESTQLHAEEKAVVQTDLDFFAIWTRKEAILKADGSGITDHLDQLNTARPEVEYRGQHYHLCTFRYDTFVLSFACKGKTASGPFFYKD